MTTTGRRMSLLGALLVVGAGRGPSADPSSGGAPPRFVVRTGEAMGTQVQVKVWTADEAGADGAIAAAFAEIARLEALFTTWRPESDVSRVNATAGVAPVTVAPETLDCVTRALEFARRSGGAFDITFYALRGLWKFDHDLDAKLPDGEEVKRRLKLVDWRKVDVDARRRTIFLREKGMAIHLGGIGKGYAVDKATAILRARGFPNAIVQAGGDLMLAGSKDGRPWQAGIRDPRGGPQDFFAVAAVVDHAFSTAGDYERFFVLGGKRYHHILDTKTGWPATACRSVTIWAPDATTADGLDDAVFVLGPEKGLKLVDGYPGAGAVVVDANNRVHVSPRVKRLLTIVHPPTP